MEEILASIRKIIADDGSAGSPAPQAASRPQAPAAAPPHPPADSAEPNSQADIDALFATEAAAEAAGAEPGDAEEDGEVFELTDAMRAPEPGEPRPAALPGPRLVETGDPDVVFAEEPVARAAAPAARQAPEPVKFAAEIERAFEAARSTTLTRSDQDARLLSPQVDAAVAGAFSDFASLILSRDARTIEDLIREMLRPMLKSWLDDNLPVLVERLVREEIERVSRAGRR